MASAPVAGTQVSGLNDSTWYSIQSFSSDYYLGLSNASQPQVELLSGDDENSTLWQFSPAGPDTSLGVYALRSASSSGLYCLFTSGDGPIAVPCGNNAGQVQAVYASTEGGVDNGIALIPFPNPQSRALSADGDSSEGDDVEFADLENESVDVLWAIRSQGVVDTSVYPPISATYTGAPSASSSSSSSAVLTTSITIYANITTSAATTLASNISTTATATPDIIVVTASDGSTIAAPTGTPSPRPDDDESSSTTANPTTTITTDIAATPSATDDATASASSPVEVQQGNEAAGVRPANLKAVWVGMVVLALLGGVAV